MQLLAHHFRLSLHYSSAGICDTAKKKLALRTFEHDLWAGILSHRCHSRSKDWSYICDRCMIHCCKQSGNQYSLHRQYNKYPSRKRQTIRWSNTCSDCFEPQACATWGKRFINNMNVCAHFIFRKSSSKDIDSDMQKCKTQRCTCFGLLLRHCA